MNAEKMIFSQVVTSQEFNQFKAYLKKINTSIETNNIDSLVDSLSRLGESSVQVLDKINKSQNILIKKYLEKHIDLNNILVTSSEKKSVINIEYQKYIPSYLKKENSEYCSIDTKIAQIDFKNKKIYLFNKKRDFKEAIKIQKNYFISEKVKIDKLNFEIEEMKINKNSRKFIISYINNKLLSQTPNSNKQSLIRTNINVFLKKTLYIEYKTLYQKILNEKKEEVEVLRENLKKERTYIYSDIYDEINSIQEIIEESFENHNFIISREI